MNLNQLYQLKHNLSLTVGGTVAKATVLAILDSHIALSIREEGRRQADDAKTCQRGTQSVQTMRIEQTRHPPSRDEVKKAYGN